MITDTPRIHSLVDLLQHHAAVMPDKTAYAFLVNGEVVQHCLTYLELDRQAKKFAVSIGRVAAPGQRVLLLYPSGPEFVSAFLGCLYAGVVAVPSAIPRLKRAAPRFMAVVNDARAQVVCTTSEIHQTLREVVEEVGRPDGMQWLMHENTDGHEEEWSDPGISPEMIAFLQYTSGSTSTPKGVMASHASLLSTLRDLNWAMGMDAETIMVGWAPMFHDLGLVVHLLATLHAGGTLYNFSPVAFIEKPVRWLRAISEYRATHTGAPNFAFDLCVERIPAAGREDLNLGSLKSALIGAEPIRPATLQNFDRAFRAQGFDYHAFAPGYGLAEATVMVSCTSVADPPTILAVDSDGLKKNRLIFPAPEQSSSSKIVGCGSSQIGADIRIVDPVTRKECAPDQIGEIWVKSASVAPGYWNRAEETQEVFQARLAESGGGPFLRTGDLGFVWNGEVFVTGRLKDMIIIQGRNIYPQDIELTAEGSHPILQPGSGAAFSVDDGRAEHLVIVQEVRREYRKSDALPAAINAIRMAVAAEHGIRTSAVVLIAPATISKTSSGKLQRGASRAAFLGGSLGVLAEWHAPEMQPGSPISGPGRV